MDAPLTEKELKRYCWIAMGALIGYVIFFTLLPIVLPIILWTR